MKSFCHHCGRQLQMKKGGGQYFVEALTPADKYPVKLHMRCVENALKEGYLLPAGTQQQKAMAKIRKQYRIPGGDSD